MLTQKECLKKYPTYAVICGIAAEFGLTYKSKNFFGGDGLRKEAIGLEPDDGEDPEYSWVHLYSDPDGTFLTVVVEGGCVEICLFGQWGLAPVRSPMRSLAEPFDIIKWIRNWASENGAANLLPKED